MHRATQWKAITLHNPPCPRPRTILSWILSTSKAETMPSETLFPYLTSTAPAPTYREVVLAYRNVLATRYAEGTLRPLVVPYHLYGGFLLMAYLCIPHTKSPVVYAARWPVLAVIIWFEWTTLGETSSQSPATALAAGLISAWGVVWSVTWLVLRRPQWDAKRVQRGSKRGYWTSLIGGGAIWRGHKPGESTKAPRKNKMEKENGRKEEPTLNISEGNDRLRNRALTNGHHKTDQVNGHPETNGVAKRSQKVPDASIGGDDDTEYYWQPFPVIDQ